MNLEESDSFKERLEANIRHRRVVVFSIVICAIAMVFLFMLIWLIQKQDAVTLKMSLDGTQVAIPQNFYKEIDGIRYVNIKEVANVIGGYKYNNGEYGKYNENADSCYLQNNYEILAITAEANKYTKYIEMTGGSIAGIGVSAKNSNGYKEDFNIEKPVKFIEGVLYAPEQYIGEMFNIALDWSNPYRIKLYSLDTLVTNAKASITTIGYTEMSGYYENLRAILDNYAIVGNGTGAYGVISLVTGQEIIGLKYTDIKYVQNSKDFFITVEDGSMGLLDSEGATLIPTKVYDKISLLDDAKQLYIVEDDNEYGVVNRKGKSVIYAENDKIGVDISNYRIEETEIYIENNNLLLDEFIPVQKDGKYGLYNTTGDLVLGKVYDGFGYISTAVSTTSGNQRSVFIIPKEKTGVSGIVINLDGLYGIFDAEAQNILLPCVCSKIYTITRSGETVYYVEYQGAEIPLKEFLITQGLIADPDLVEEPKQYVEDTQDEENPEEPLESEDEEVIEQDEQIIEPQEEISEEDVVEEENVDEEIDGDAEQEEIVDESQDEQDSEQESDAQEE